MKALLDQVKKARKVGTPLVAISTPDMPAMAIALAQTLKGEPVLSWDAARGLRPSNEGGKEAFVALRLAEDEEFAAQSNPAFAFGERCAGRLPERSIIIATGLQKFLANPELAQAVLNLRDAYAGNFRCVIVLGPALDLPVELRADFVALEDPLPDEEGYREIVRRLHSDASVTDVEVGTVCAAATAVRGLSAFGAEQVLAMSLGKTGIDVEAAWEHKRAAVNQIPGLTMTLDGPALEDVKGQDAIVKVYRALFNGPAKPQAVVLLDEVEKMMAGANPSGPGDNTGVSQDAHMQLLTAMEDNGWTGSIIPGVPGTGKTLFAKSIGRAHGVPLVKVDLGGMKKEHVGSSEARIREAMRTIKSIGDGRVVVLATCNRVEALSPEFKRRFRMPTFYFDTPTQAEAEVLWEHYLAVYEVHKGADALAMAERCPGWTGAEVRNACELARNLGMDVSEAAGYIVPLVVSASESIEALRKQADGRWLSASTGKLYRRTISEEPVSRRRVQV